MHTTLLRASPPLLRSRGAVLLCAVLLAGCMSEKDGYGDSGPSDSGEVFDTGLDDTGEDTGRDEIPPAWRRMAAEVLVEDGGPVPDESRLRVTLLASEADAFAEVCTGIWTPASLSAETSPDASVLAWWEVDPGSGDGACPDGAMPPSLHLGVGTLHPDVAALLGAEGWTGAQDVLYGAYVLLPDPGDLWTFGYAWTREAVEDGTPASTTPPLPDGVWNVVPVYLLPY